MTFWQEVDNRVMGHLIASGGKLNGKYIQNLECPSCGNLEAYANASKPRAMYCNRKNKCGSTTDIDAKISSNKDLEKYTFNGEKIAYELKVTLDESKKVMLGEDSYAVSIFKNDCVSNTVKVDDRLITMYLP